MSMSSSQTTVTELPSNRGLLNRQYSKVQGSRPGWAPERARRAAPRREQGANG